MDTPCDQGEPEMQANAKSPFGYNDLQRLMTMMTGDEKHSTSATSTLDVIWTLYDSVLRVSPDDPDDPERDRFLLSKGHGPMAYYAVLAAKGFIPVEWLANFGAFDSPLGYHPDRNLVPGVEIASGSLGHGLPIATGVASALRIKGMTEPRVFCLIGDAELDEGSNHEAIALAGRLGLDRLTAIVMDNRSSTHGWPGGIEARFEVEGWSSAVIDGRDHEDIVSGLLQPHPNQPHVVVAVVEEK
jgi:transketolase